MVDSMKLLSYYLLYGRRQAQVDVALSQLSKLRQDGQHASEKQKKNQIWREPVKTGQQFKSGYLLFSFFLQFAQIWTDNLLVILQDKADKPY